MGDVDLCQQRGSRRTKTSPWTTRVPWDFVGNVEVDVGRSGTGRRSRSRVALLGEAGHGRRCAAGGPSGSGGAAGGEPPAAGRVERPAGTAGTGPAGIDNVRLAQDRRGRGPGDGALAASMVAARPMSLSRRDGDRAAEDSADDREDRPSTGFFAYRLGWAVSAPLSKRMAPGRDAELPLRAQAARHPGQDLAAITLEPPRAPIQVGSPPACATRDVPHRAPPHRPPKRRRDRRQHVRTGVAVGDRDTLSALTPDVRLEAATAPSERRQESRRRRSALPSGDVRAAAGEVCRAGLWSVARRRCGCVAAGLDRDTRCGWRSGRARARARRPGSSGPTRRPARDLGHGQA